MPDFPHFGRTGTTAPKNCNIRFFKYIKARTAQVDSLLAHSGLNSIYSNRIFFSNRFHYFMNLILIHILNAK